MARTLERATAPAHSPGSAEVGAAPEEALRPGETRAEDEDFLPIQAVEYVEFWVGNAYQAAQYYRTHFGFDVIAYAGPETGVRGRASYVLKQGEITFVLTAALRPDTEVAAHGDGVRDIALRVPDVDAAFRETTKRGATGVQKPRTLQGSRGTARQAS